ncbi:MAG: two-component regulator propeller domain-containing protein, partial [Bacteroidales bacterium]
MSLVISAHAQSWQFIRYAEEEGLSNTLVKSVTADKNGFIWIATDDGIFRFDGHNFLHIHDELPSKYVKSVICSQNGDIVASTDLGVVRIETSPQKYKVSIVKMGSVKEVDSLMSYPKAIYKDRNGVLWISDNHKIYSVKGASIKGYSTHNKAFSNNFQRAFSFVEDGFGNLYCFSEPGFVFRYDVKSDNFIEVSTPQRLTKIQSVVLDSLGTMLVATHDGVFELQFDHEANCKKMSLLRKGIEASYLLRLPNGNFLAGTWANGLLEIIKDGNEYVFSQVSDFPGKNVNHLWYSGDGNIWIGSDNGLFLMKNVFFGAPYQEFSNTYIQDVNEFADGRICFTDGEKVIVTHPGSKIRSQILKKSKTTILHALPVQNGIWYSDVDANIWFEDQRGTVIRSFNFKAYGNAVFHLTADAAGNLWACQDANPSLICITSNFTVKQYGSSKGITSRPLVTTLNKHGRVFAGGMSDTAYLFGYVPGTDRFINLSKPLVFERNIDINVNDMAFNKKSVLWIGTSFGLIKYENETFERLVLGDMTSDAVKAVAIDQNDNVWFGNSLGLHQINGGELLSFDERSGMHSKSIDYRCILIDKGNRVWAGTVGGMVVSAPISHPTKTVTPIILDLLMNNSYSIPISLKGTYFSDKSFVTIKIGIPDYPVKYLKVEMLLSGKDSNWIPVSKSNEIILANLSPGNYKLMIRAKQYGNFLYSKPLEWEFTVKRMWYFRWWFIL